MALGWFGVLSKVIPWGDVIAAAPQIVKGAKQLFRSTRSGGAESSADAEAKNLSDPDARIRTLSAKLAQVQTEQRESAALIQSLAEQNARLVEAVEILRRRTRILIYAGAGTAVAIVAMAVWVATI